MLYTLCCISVCIGSCPGYLCSSHVKAILWSIVGYRNGEYVTYHRFLDVNPALYGSSLHLYILRKCEQRTYRILYRYVLTEGYRITVGISEGPGYNRMSHREHVILGAGSGMNHLKNVINLRERYGYIGFFSFCFYLDILRYGEGRLGFICDGYPLYLFCNIAIFVTGLPGNLGCSYSIILGCIAFHLNLKYVCGLSFSYVQLDSSGVGLHGYIPGYGEFRSRCILNQDFLIASCYIIVCINGLPGNRGYSQGKIFWSIAGNVHMKNVGCRCLSYVHNRPSAFCLCLYVLGKCECRLFGINHYDILDSGYFIAVCIFCFPGYRSFSHRELFRCVMGNGYTENVVSCGLFQGIRSVHSRSFYNNISLHCKNRVCCILYCYVLNRRGNEPYGVGSRPGYLCSTY